MQGSSKYKCKSAQIIATYLWEHKFGPLLWGCRAATLGDPWGHKSRRYLGTFGETSSGRYIGVSSGRYFWDRLCAQVRAGTFGNLWGHKFGLLPRDRYFLEPLGTQVRAVTLGYQFGVTSRAATFGNLWGHKSGHYFGVPSEIQVGPLFGVPV